MITDKNGVPLMRGQAVTFVYADMFGPQQVYFAGLVADKKAPMRGIVNGMFEGERFASRCAHQDKTGELVQHLGAFVDVEVKLSESDLIQFPMDPAKLEAKAK